VELNELLEGEDHEGGGGTAASPLGTGYGIKIGTTTVEIAGDDGAMGAWCPGPAGEELAGTATTWPAAGTPGTAWPDTLAWGRTVPAAPSPAAATPATT